MYLQHLVFVTPLLLPTAIVEKLEHTVRGDLHCSGILRSIEW
jgi:hypothetical protein